MTTSDLFFEAPISAPVTLHRPAKPVTPQGPWTIEAIQALLDKPLMDLLFEAQTVHRRHFPAGDIELATLLSVKTGGCPEDCHFCSQSNQFGRTYESFMTMKLTW